MQKYSETAFNLVGFQANLTWETKARITLIQAWNADLSIYGVVHRNSFVDSPHALDRSLEFQVLLLFLQVKSLWNPEGYAEAIITACSLLALNTATLSVRQEEVKLANNLVWPSCGVMQQIKHQRLPATCAGIF